MGAASRGNKSPLNLLIEASVGFAHKCRKFLKGFWEIGKKTWLGMGAEMKWLLYEWNTDGQPSAPAAPKFFKRRDE